MKCAGGSPSATPAPAACAPSTWRLPTTSAAAAHVMSELNCRIISTFTTFNEMPGVRNKKGSGTAKRGKCGPRIRCCFGLACASQARCKYGVRGAEKAINLKIWIEHSLKFFFPSYTPPRKTAAALHEPDKPVPEAAMDHEHRMRTGKHPLLCPSCIRVYLTPILGCLMGQGYRCAGSDLFYSWSEDPPKTYT